MCMRRYWARGAAQACTAEIISESARQAGRHRHVRVHAEARVFTCGSARNDAELEAGLRVGLSLRETRVGLGVESLCVTLESL